MKKNLFLTLMLAVLCTATAWAEFAPESGKKYALKEKTTGLFLDIQTLGITDPNATSNNISLNTKPCIIFFEDGSTAGQWKIKNINGGYLYHLDDDGWGQIWNPQIGTKGEVKEWVITETETNVITIARAEGNYLYELNYIFADNLTPASPLYCSSKTGLEFELVEYTAAVCNKLVYTVLSPIGTSLHLDPSMTNADTRTKFSSAKHYFNLSKDGNGYQIENNGKYLAYNVLHDVWGVNTWGTGANDGTENATWLISDFDDDGLALISHTDPWNNVVYLGSNFSTGAGGYIYANVGADCNRWYFEGTTDYPTTATLNNGKYKFTSDKISYALPFNKLRFTLIESDAKYNNKDFNRFSFDSFVLYNANGDPVKLDAADFHGNNAKDYENMLDGVNGKYCCSDTWNAGTESHDWFEIDLHNIDLGGEFSFSFVTENENMNAKAFRIDAYYRSDVYPLVIEGYPDDVEVTVTYDGQPVQPEAEFSISAINTELFRATRIDGYTWSVVIDRESKKIIIRYTPATIAEDALHAVYDLVNRIGGEGTAEKFKFVLDPSMNSVNEVFEISGEDGIILIKGTTISAITTGIGWYLQNYAHINISWNSLNEKGEDVAYADLSGITAPTTTTERRTCDAKYRYFLNYCTFGYSMSTWTWKRWQQEIDWMALHGINMPLQIVGLEEVWRTFLTMKDENGAYKYGYDNEDAKNFVAGPAFTAWWGMNNLEGWGGTKAGVLNGGVWDGAGGVQDDAWYARQKQLAQQICERQRQLGMQPVLPGFSGMVPHDFQNESGYITRENGGYWAGGFQRPMILSIENEDYAAIAADYYACLKEVMGESQYYSMDPFHEGGGTGTVNDYQYLYNAMEAANPGSQWVIQQWQWYPHQKLSLTAVPAGRLIVLDLFSDGSPAFNAYNGYAPHEAVFCAIPNFGGRSGLMGRLNNLTDNYFNYKATYPSIKGIGAAPEAIEQTPVTYDLLFQLPWMGSKPNVKEWVKNYATARYGVENAEMQAAWELLRQGPLNYGADGIQGPVEDVWAARPNLEAKAASSWGSTLSRGHNIPAPENTYTKERQQMLIQATYKLLSQNSAVSGAVNQSNYNYDVVELGGAVMADYAHYLLLGIKAAKEAAGDTFATDPVYIARRDAFLALIEEVDAFKGTNLNFRLGKWTQEARAAAGEIKGASSATADWYEFNNARTLITTWSSPGTDLNDYSYRSWQGMMKDYYLPRWQAYFSSGCNDNLDYRFFEWNWAHGLVHAVGQTAVSKDKLVSGQPGYSYTAEPVGDAVELANELLAKYMIPVNTGNGTYYAHRHIANDLTNMVTIVAEQGETIDLTRYFGELQDATVTGEFMDGAVTDLTAVPVNGANNNRYTGSVTLADGTVITFTVSLESAFYGVYRLKLATHKDSEEHVLDPKADVFVQYNTDKEEGSSDGYKLIATSTAHEAHYELDKYFTIMPAGNGFTLSAQGMYLKQPETSTWNHIAFSDNRNDAGVYLFDEENTTEHLYSIHFGSEGINYLNAYDKFVFGNDASPKFSTFAFEKVTSYELTTPASGEVAVCLPFNIVLPDGLVAYDVTEVKADDNVEYAYVISPLATSGEKVKAGTPVLLRGDKNTEYNLVVTADETGAIGALQGSLLRGNLIKGQLTVDNVANRYTFDADTEEFKLLTAPLAELAANSVWMELAERIETPITKDYKGHLAEIIKGMENLTDVVATYSETAEETFVEVLLHTTEGPYYIWSNATDAGSDISYLLDNKPATHFHSNWQSTTAPADGLDHHLTIELGEGNGLSEFKFHYKARTETGQGLADYPATIVVQGSNNGKDYEDIATVYPRNASNGHVTNGAEWTSDLLSKDGKSYTYLRFMVTETSHAQNKKDGHTYWHMAEFDLYKKVQTPSADVRSYLEGAINNVEATTAYYALNNAKYVYETGKTEAEFDAAATMLEREYNDLLALLNDILPVKLTFDKADPVLYKIIIKRAEDGKKVLGYDNTDGMVAVADKADNKSWQAWYFMGGVNGVTIHPYNADGNVLSADNTNNGAAKVWAVKKGEKKYYEWKFVSRSNGYFNIQAHDGSNYFSNNGGVDYKMGFWNDKPSSDGGSLFKFIDADFENDNARYYQLSDIIETMLEPKADPGYPKEGYDEYAPAYKAAKALVAAGNTSNSADCYTAYQRLRSTYPNWNWSTMTADNLFKPVNGAVYRIRNYIKNSSEHNHYLVNDGTQIGLPTTVAGDNTAALWVCLEENGKYKFVSASGAAAFGWNHTMKETAEGMLKETPTSFAMGKGVEFGTVTLADVVDNTNYCMSLTGKEWKDKGSVLFNYSTGGAYNSSSDENNQWSTDWYLETVEDANVVYDRIVVAGHHWGTLYLPYAVEVPENLTAYYAKTVDKEKKVIDLYNVGEVIPAYTAVVFNRADDSATETFSFCQTAENATTTASGNLLDGRIMTSAVGGDGDNNNYYLLMNASKGEAFYWVFKEFGADAEIAAGNAGTHNGKYIKCEANKAFLALPAGTTNPAALSFRYGGDTTDIEEVKGENGKVKTIYDLQGRKLSEITEPGIYIVNGNKVLVK